MKLTSNTLSALAFAGTAMFAQTAVQAQDLTEAQARNIIAPLYKNFTVPQGDVVQKIDM